MSIDSDIAAALETVAAGKVFPDTAPAGTAFPWVAYQQIGGPAINFLSGAAPNFEGVRLQVLVWHSTRIGANALMRQIETALRGAPLFATVEGSLIARHEPMVGAYGAMQDFSFWRAPA